MHDCLMMLLPESMQMLKEKMDEAKVVLLGDSAVGKSSIVLRFIHGEFDDHSQTTIGVSFVTKIHEREDGSAIKFQIWDTAGQEQYHSLASLYYRGAQAALVVFDITRRKSFSGVKTWVHELKRFGPDDVVVVIVGNKVDLSDRRTVSIEEAQTYAESRGALYFETSAKTDENIDDVFNEVSLKLFEKGNLKRGYRRPHEDGGDGGPDRIGAINLEEPRQKKCC